MFVLDSNDAETQWSITNIYTGQRLDFTRAEGNLLAHMFGDEFADRDDWDEDR